MTGQGNADSYNSQGCVKSDNAAPCQLSNGVPDVWLTRGHASPFLSYLTFVKPLLELIDDMIGNRRKH